MNIIKYKLYILFVVFFIVSCGINPAIIVNNKNDFISGCINSGEFGEEICECVYNDLQKNYKYNFSEDEKNLDPGSIDNNIYNQKIIEVYGKCNDF
ncbi:hypothetical protein [Acinetobacter amyesii]|uniref:hypothetical protein n=1 Tax=Acinetobacter amyesii TaxID=2942470 RepID=UPI0020BDC305|nr:hypothetical protein [Acinetobacter amyesii]MCL6242931.1 hypothetical protein [Acinetobacter amyesii]